MVVKYFYAKSKDGQKIYRFKYVRTRNHWIAEHDLIKSSRKECDGLLQIDEGPMPDIIRCNEAPPPRKKPQVSYADNYKSVKKLPPLRPQSNRVLRKEIDHNSPKAEYDINHYIFHDGANSSGFDFDAYHVNLGINQGEYRRARRRKRLVGLPKKRY